MPFAFRFYAFLMWAFTPMLKLFAKRRLKAGKEIEGRLSERFGEMDFKATRPVVWLHAASIGEMNAILPLISRLVARHDVLLTTMTKTSAQLALTHLPKGAYHRFVPYDARSFVSRFLDEVKPVLAIFTEQELWINLIYQTKSRAIPLILVNGRISEKSYLSWMKYPKLIKSLLSQFDLVLAQSYIDCQRFKALGFEGVQNLGNMKYDGVVSSSPLAFPERLVWLAASTHEGEEAAAMRVHIRLKANFPSLLTMIAPRHIERFDEVPSGLVVARRSLGQDVTPQIDIYICDTFGEMPALYASSHVSLMGKSLYGAGGQNPLEAIRAGSVVVSGLNLANFQEIYDVIKDVSYRVADENALYDCLFSLLSDPDLCALRAREAKLAIAPFEGAVLRTYLAIQGYLT